MNQAAEPVSATKPIEFDHVYPISVLRQRHSERRSLAERVVRGMLVVAERDDGGHHAFEMSAAEDQKPVEAFAAQAADPAFRVCSRLGCSHRRLITRSRPERKTSSKSRANVAVTVAD